MSEKPQTAIEIAAKAEIKTEIPSHSSGRTLDAITDLIRPISETLGWAGDLIRSQREKTLNKIAERARERLSKNTAEVEPIPTKFLLPLLERASLEDASDDKLIEMWANLLVTCATDKVELIAQYGKILSEITSDQVKLLEDMLGLEPQSKWTVGHLIDNYYYLNLTGLPGSLSKFSDIEDIAQFANALLAEVDIMGVAVDCINVYAADEAIEESTSLTPEDGIYSDEKFYDFENLRRMGLIEKVEIKCHRVGRFDLDVHYYMVTPVGADLYACCNPDKLPRENSELRRLAGPSEGVSQVD